MSSAVNLPASLGPKEPAAIRPGSMSASDGSRLCADHAGILSLPVISLQPQCEGQTITAYVIARIRCLASNGSLLNGLLRQLTAVEHLLWHSSMDHERSLSSSLCDVEGGSRRDLLLNVLFSRFMHALCTMHICTGTPMTSW